MSTTMPADLIRGSVPASVGDAAVEVMRRVEDAGVLRFRPGALPSPRTIEALQALVNARLLEQHEPGAWRATSGSFASAL